MGNDKLYDESITEVKEDETGEETETLDETAETQEDGQVDFAVDSEMDSDSVIEVSVAPDEYVAAFMENGADRNADDLSYPEGFEEDEEASDEPFDETEKEDALNDIAAEEETQDATEGTASEEETEDATENATAEEETGDAIEEAAAEEQPEEATEEAAAEEETEDAAEEAAFDEEPEDAAEEAAFEEEAQDAAEEAAAEEEAQDAAGEAAAEEEAQDAAGEAAAEEETEEAAAEEEPEDSGTQEAFDYPSDRDYSVQEVLDELLAASEEEEPVQVFHSRKEEKVDIMEYLNEDALTEIDEKCADIDVSPAPVPQESDLEHTQVFDIGSTRVYAPVTVEDGYVDEPSEPDRYTSGMQAPRKPKKRAGLLQIAALLVVVAGLAWLVSKAAFSVMGSGQDGDTHSAPYEYSSSDTVIKQFDDGTSDTVSSVIPEFDTDQLTVGDTGELVWSVQRRLNLFGYLASASVSGTYDKATAAAVKQFQKANALEQSGVVDKTTFDVMFDSDAATQTTVTTLLPTSTTAETTAVTTTEEPTQQTTTATESTTTETTTETSSHETDASKATSAETEPATSSATETATTTTLVENTEENVKETVDNE